MAVAKKPNASPKIVAKAKQVLAYAQNKARTCTYSNELFNAIFSPAGKAAEIFPGDSERAAFFRTKEYRKIRELEKDLPKPPVQFVGDLMANGNLAVTLRLPKSLHTALLTEAAEEGVSLDQLCLSKLVAQLRELV